MYDTGLWAFVSMSPQGPFVKLIELMHVIERLVPYLLNTSNDAYVAVFCSSVRHPSGLTHM